MYMYVSMKYPISFKEEEQKEKQVDEVSHTETHELETTKKRSKKPSYAAMFRESSNTAYNHVQST